MNRKIHVRCEVGKITPTHLNEWHEDDYYLSLSREMRERVMAIAGAAQKIFGSQPFMLCALGYYEKRLTDWDISKLYHS